MTKYRNPREEAEMLEDEAKAQEEELLNEPATTVEEEKWKKRYGDQQRYLNQIKSETKAEVDRLRTQLEKAVRGQMVAPKSRDEVEEWMKEYPEFSGVLHTFVEEKVADKLRDADERLGNLEQRQKNVERDEAVIALKKIHPDFDELVNSTDFHDWLKEQDDIHQTAIYKGLNVKSAAFVIKMYKEEKKIVGDKPSKSTNREAAMKVRTPAVAQDFTNDFGDYEYSESQIERESKKNPRWWDEHEDKIMAAQRKGKIFMDLSGGAR